MCHVQRSYSYTFTNLVQRIRILYQELFPGEKKSSKCYNYYMTVPGGGGGYDNFFQVQIFFQTTPPRACHPTVGCKS